MSKRYLVLADGTMYTGEGFGAAASAVGELVFNTSVVGYIETLTDPNNLGQIVVQTFPSLGNYGVIEADFDGPCAVKGYVVREWCREPSNFRSEYTLDEYLKAHGVPGICGLDTRSLTQHIRDHGEMNAMICDRVPEDLSALKAEPVTAMGSKETTVYPANGTRKFAVTMLDFGARPSAVRLLTERGCAVAAVPPTTPAGAILAARPDGVVLSDGPGDPAKAAQAIETVKALMGRVPMFGLGLGHQVMALAAGGKTYRLKYGHRGGNQPVIDLTTGHTYITGQNHGYVVSAEHQPGVLRYVNANDDTCEGIDYPDLNAFSVQFIPSPCPGPRDTCVVYDRFIDMM